MATGKKRSAKGLVVGFLERVSSRVLEEFQEQIKELVGGKHGVYALYRNNQLYYVGLATKLRVRIKQHLKDRHKGLWTHFSLSCSSKRPESRIRSSLAGPLSTTRWTWAPFMALPSTSTRTTTLLSLAGAST
ncbi:MAG: GIY-YIG nuclease family protein [Deltaproteobacteria bacterium]|nr:GIY-YIG nuclease family protein [Deltaproteobacteria bacterium]